MKLATIIATCLMGASSLGLGAEAEIARAPQSAPEAGLEELSKFITLRGEGSHFENVCRSLFERTRDYRRNGTTHALNEAKLYADEALVLMSLLQDLTEGEEVKMRTAALSLLAEGLLELSTYVEPSCRDRYFNGAVKIAAENASCAAQVQEHIERLQKRTSQLAQLKAKLPKGAWLPPNELALRTDPLTNLIAVAEKMLSEPLPKPSDADYFLFWTMGNRTNYEKNIINLRRQLYVLTLAEVQEQKGRFIPRLEEVIDTICNLKSWVLPAHDKTESGRGTWRQTCPLVDLFSSEIAAYLACSVQALGNRLSATGKARIYAEVERRIFTPLRRDVHFHVCQGGSPTWGKALNWWISGYNNWNAVCWDNVVCAAAGLIADAEERAFFVDAALKSMKLYIAKGFAADGYCSEGMGYWNYGFGHHMQMGLLMRKLSHNAIDIFNSARERQIAAYARAFSVLPGIAPTFSDGAGAVSPRILALVDSVWTDLPKELPPYSEFPSGQVWLFRDPDGLSVAFKGGHNDEYHNHNDVGSYWIASKGKFVSGDPGSEVYTRFTFSSKRYDSPINSSYAHPVPVVGGCLQGTGATYKAKLIDKTLTAAGGQITLDLSACYKVPTLKTLIRTFAYNREQKTFVVRDEVHFSAPTSFEDVLMTFGEPFAVSVKCIGGDFTVKEEDIPNPNRRAPHRKAYVFKKPLLDAVVTFTFSAD